jgi:predicted peptidase
MAMTRTDKVYAKIPYIEYMPAQIDGILFYFHGMGERGTDLNVLEGNPIPELYKNGTIKNFLTICPQLSKSYTSWSSTAQNLLLDLAAALQLQYNVPVHITGLSLGGYTTIGMIKRAYTKFSRNDFFLSAGIVCGLSNETNMLPYLGTNIKWWHGTLDGTNPYNTAVVFKRRLAEAGGSSELHTYEGAGHDIWDDAYNEDSTSYWAFIEQFVEGGEVTESEGTIEVINGTDAYIVFAEGNTYKINASITKQ